MIRAARASDNPSMLSPGAETVRDFSGTWWVAHTKSRFEKAFARDLQNRGVDYFLPMAWKTSISSGKKRRFLCPLFPSYVFFCGDEDAKYTAITTSRLCQVIQVVSQERLVDQLAGIELVLHAKVELDSFPYAAIGCRCRIVSGAMKGIEGIVVQRNKKAKLVLEVSMLGQGVLVEIDACLLESAD